MRYVSTRGLAPAVDFFQAVEQGLAPDGGLYVPAEWPDLRPKLAAWAGLDYPALAAAFWAEFAGSRGPGGEGEKGAGAAQGGPGLAAGGGWEGFMGRSYAHFSHPEVAALVPLRAGERLWVLELFHGPTLAFKDFALQVLGNLYAEQIRRTGQPIHVLGATSGDTGAAAIHGLAGKAGVHTFILYPLGRVSPLQERQMTCTGDPAVFPLGIEGSFDDAQAALKELFGDVERKEKLRLAAVNSINLARILAQCVYYLWAWLRLPPGVREEAEWAVPTGNFGNVLAGWMLPRMGVPMGSFRVATNRNDILDRFFRTGVYERGVVEPSVAPSMDIQVASNFERFVYFGMGGDAARCREAMAAFGRTGRVDLRGLERGSFSSSRAGDASIRGLIRKMYLEYNYICDPHTACAAKDLEADGRPRVILATAHPAKFPETVGEATGMAPTHPALEELRGRRPVVYPVRAEAGAIADFIAAHPASC